MNRPYYFQKLINLFIHYPKSIFARYRFSNPSNSLKIIAVTGTDGKTTTSNMIFEILKQAGLKVGVISTISARFNDQEYDTGFHVTSPDPIKLQKFLKKMVSENIDWVILETTSHGLDQYRFSGIKIDYAVFTNITHEHLDYHKTYNNYLNAKAKLLKMLKFGGKVILNIDDEGCKKIQKKALDMDKDQISISLQSRADILIKNVEPGLKDLNFTYSIHNPEAFNPSGTTLRDISITIPIFGEYNIYNASLAITTAILILSNNKDLEKIIKTSLENFTSPLGRMQILKEKPFQIIVDFAHTPNALEKALTTLKNKKKNNGRVIVVFGCAGRRDVQKRYLMGEIAARLADIIVLTAEDPRDEELAMINNQIVEGISKVNGWNIGNTLSEIETSLNHLYFRFDEMSVNSRIEAIKFALRIAKNDDIVVICGKGHEKSLCFYKTEIPYSDQEVVMSIIK